MFRRQKIGPLVGTRTWGGLIGIGGYPELIDGDRITAPRWAIYNPESGEFDVENEGVAPDVEVELDPAAWRQGRDPQFEKGVALALKELKRNPAKRPSIPCTTGARCADRRRPSAAPPPPRYPDAKAVAVLRPPARRRRPQPRPGHRPPETLRPYIVNWPDVAGRLTADLHREVGARAADDELARLLVCVLAQPGVPLSLGAFVLLAKPSTSEGERTSNGCDRA